MYYEVGVEFFIEELRRKYCCQKIIFYGCLEFFDVVDIVLKDGVMKVCGDFCVIKYEVIDCFFKGSM